MNTPVTHIYRGDVGTYGVHLTTDQPRSDLIVRIRIVVHLAGDSTLIPGLVHVVPRSKVTEGIPAVGTEEGDNYLAFLMATTPFNAIEPAPDVRDASGRSALSGMGSLLHSRTYARFGRLVAIMLGASDADDTETTVEALLSGARALGIHVDPDDQPHWRSVADKLGVWYDGQEDEDDQEDVDRRIEEYETSAAYLGDDYPLRSGD